MKNLGTKRLETDRLILRKAKSDDYKDAFKNWGNSNLVDKYVTWTKHKNINVTKELYDEWINEYDDKTYRWIIEDKKSHEAIGMIGLSKKFLSSSTCEVAYCLGDKFWNKGIMSEALKEVIRFLFLECDAKTIWAEFLENNPASGKVMEKVGMKYEGTLRKRVVDKDGIRNDLLVYSILSDEYTNMHEMKLQPRYYDYILSGTKRIEIRLNDEKRKNIKVGDRIKFLKEPDLSDSFVAKVVDIYHCDSFLELFNDFDISLLADKSMDKEELLEELEKFYTKDKQKMYGVVGIKLDI